MSILVIQVKYPGRLTLRWTLVHREFVSISLGISVYGGGMLIGLGKGEWNCEAVLIPQGVLELSCPELSGGG